MSQPRPRRPFIPGPALTAALVVTLALAALAAVHVRPGWKKGAKKTKKKKKNKEKKIKKKIEKKEKKHKKKGKKNRKN